MSTATLSPSDIIALLEPKRRNKYGVRTDAAGKAMRTFLGVQYDSRAESNYAASLEVMRLAGKIRQWDRQVCVPLEVNGIKVCEMRIDFMVTWPDGRQDYVDVKGVVTPDWNLKKKLFEALTGKKITIVKK